MSGVAAQLGINVQTGDAGQSPQFYADLVQSHDLLVGVLNSRIPDVTRGRQDSVAIIDLLGTKDGDSKLRIEKGVRELQKATVVSLAQKTGVIALSVTTRKAPLSQAIARRILDYVNQYNTVVRQSQAALEREFTERRLEEVRSELRAAEDRLQSLLQENRAFEGSEQLKFERDRRMRDVSMRQQLYTTLAQAYEQAKIEEVRDTPVTTIIDQPSLPLRGDSRRLIEKALLAFVIGICAGILYSRRSWLLRRANPESEAFETRATV